MATLVWDQTSDRQYEYGVDHGLLQLIDDVVFPWNGLTSVDEEETDDTVLRSYIDGMNYANFQFGGFYQATVKTLYFPDALSSILGLKEIFPGLSLTAQPRLTFNMSYRTLLGEDDYKIHLVYNALATQSNSGTTTVSDKTEPTEFELTISTRPPASTVFRPTAHMVVNSVTSDPDILSTLEDTLYGTVSVEPNFPTQDEVLAIFGP